MKPFVPHKLPLESLNWGDLIEFIGSANRALARYDGLLLSIPNPAVLLSPLTMQEAVLSSKIEGTQATLEEVLRFEADARRVLEGKDDVVEVLNYRKAMAFAVNELRERPITLNLLRRTHEILLDSVRGKNKDRGNFRRLQNWIGSAGSTIATARFIPPSPAILGACLSDFEKYIHFEDKDVLVQLAIVHAQFEIIHPFLDGNGRIGRILIPLFLFEKKILNQPMFYISEFFEKNRQEYYDRLKNITDQDDWEGWITFFLRAVIEQAKANSEKAKAVLDLYEMMKIAIVEKTHSQFAIQALDSLFNIPLFATHHFMQFTGINKPSASRILTKLKDEGLIEVLEQGRGRKPTFYMFSRLLSIIDK